MGALFKWKVVKQKYHGAELILITSQLKGIQVVKDLMILSDSYIYYKKSEELKMEKTFIEIGAGKGLGNAVAKKFAENGYKIVLMSRSVAHLKEYQAEFAKDGYSVDICHVDVSNQEQLKETLNKIKEQYPDIDTVHYNVGVTLPDSECNMNEKIMSERYQIDVIGAYQVMQTFANEEFAQKKGNILITGGGLAMYPMTDYLPLSMDKAALRAMVIAEHNEWKEKGLYIGIVTVTNVIGHAEGYEPDTIAEQFWKLFVERENVEIVY